MDNNQTKKFKMVIVGGGTAGWLCAAWFCKFMPNIEVSLIESPDIPKIGVGESVTPHVSAFFSELGITDQDFMKNTGSVKKYANKFVNWRTGNGESEYFSFSYPTDVNLLMKDVHYATAVTDWAYSAQTVRTTDTLLKLLANQEFNKFDKQFNSQYSYMDNNTSPYSNSGEYLLNPLYSSAHHINADIAAEYVRDKIALPNNVLHIKALVNQVVTEGDNIKHLVLDNEQVITGDLFVDASGFHRVLVNQWPTKKYNDMPIDSAWVCQLDYNDPENEMVNYTQSIAQDYGWLFKIGLYHRMGSGYCFNSSAISDEQARDDYCNMVNNRRAEPRLIKWKADRLEQFAKGNTAAIGLSCGFVEPMEANALYVIVTSITKLHETLANYFNTDTIDFRPYNDILGYAIDDIADFLLLHYTLSSRQQNDFWKSLQDFGIKNNHVDLAYEKYTNERNTMASALQGKSLFPDYMWAQLAYSWGVDISSWVGQNFNPLHLQLSKLHFEHLENKHRLISQTRMNNHVWHRLNRFDNLSPEEWQATFLK